MQPVQIHQIAVGEMANFSYLIADTAAGKAAYVDPGWEAEKVLSKAKAEGLKIEKILLTHTHFDHIQDLGRAWELTQAPVFVHALEAGSVEGTGIPVHAIASEETIRVGEVEIACLHMPGHTPGMICFYAPPHLITGDMLFVDGCGRVDLPGSDPEAMFKSLCRLAQMPGETVIYPGHDYGPAPTDMLDRQKKTNPYLRAAVVGKDVFFRERGV